MVNYSNSYLPPIHRLNPLLMIDPREEVSCSVAWWKVALPAPELAAYGIDQLDLTRENLPFDTGDYRDS